MNGIKFRQFHDPEKDENLSALFDCGMYDLFNNKKKANIWCSLDIVKTGLIE